MDIKLIASDIDGTLLPKGGSISEATKDAVNGCQEQGITFALASGRWYPSTAIVARELGCEGPLIVANGGCVISVDGEILKEFPMEAEDVRRAYAAVKDSGALITSYVRGAIYRLNTLSMENRPPERFTYYDGRAYEVVDNDILRFEAEALTGVYKMEVYSNNLDLLVGLRKELTEMGLNVSSSFITNIEITSQGMGKGRALEWLAEHLGVGLDRTMAFGDNTNDMPLICTAGVGVAMGNAVDELKAAAKAVAGPCDRDGLAKFLEEHVLK